MGSHYCVTATANISYKINILCIILTHLKGCSRYSREACLKLQPSTKNRPAISVREYATGTICCAIYYYYFYIFYPKIRVLIFVYLILQFSITYMLKTFRISESFSVFQNKDLIFPLLSSRCIKSMITSTQCTIQNGHAYFYSNNAFILYIAFYYPVFKFLTLFSESSLAMAF